jgi:peptide/nickel transport system permease protein
MLKFILKRVLSGVVLMFGLTTVAFFLLYLGSGDIARRILGPLASDEQVAAKKHELGLDKSIVHQYVDWLKDALSGNLGRSWFTGQEVREGITDRLSVTLTLVIGATVIGGVIAVALGVWAAVRRGWVDQVVQVISVLGLAIPGFLVALGAVSAFALHLHWFDATGYVTFGTSPGKWLKSITLPVLALAFGSIAAIAPQIRGSVIDGLQRDYVRTLRSRGLSSKRVVLRHVLRNAGGPALSVLGLQFIGMFGAAVVVEQVFALPGLGQVSIIATGQGDIPFVMGLVVVTAMIVVVVNLAVDLLQGWLNPKARQT